MTVTQSEVTPETLATSPVHNEQEKQGSTSQINDSSYQHVEEPVLEVTPVPPKQESPETEHVAPVETKTTAVVAVPEPEQAKTPVKELHTPKQAVEPVPDKPTHQPEPARMQTLVVTKPETLTPPPPVVQTPAETKATSDSQLPGKKEPEQPAGAPESL